MADFETVRSTLTFTVRVPKSPVIYNFRELPAILLSAIRFYRTGVCTPVLETNYTELCDTFLVIFPAARFEEPAVPQSRARVAIRFPNVQSARLLFVRIIKRSLCYSYGSRAPFTRARIFASGTSRSRFWHFHNDARDREWARLVDRLRLLARYFNSSNRSGSFFFSWERWLQERKVWRGNEV